ncbi:hypothetical protein [Sorangium sp. So ce362]|uniref:hypothetical protein n=1 Tax=Sorangium sp. So ce362 TaxID=3133303 RepID=UPI003F5EAF07
MQNSDVESLGARLGLPADGLWPWVIVAASVPVGFALARLVVGLSSGAPVRSSCDGRRRHGTKRRSTRQLAP